MEHVYEIPLIEAYFIVESMDKPFHIGAALPFEYSEEQDKEGITDCY